MTQESPALSGAQLNAADEALQTAQNALSEVRSTLSSEKPAPKKRRLLRWIFGLLVTAAVTVAVAAVMSNER